jgi:hypothetical protein
MYSWKKFNITDVDYLRQFREANLTCPDADEHFHAASLCIQGLIAHGWTYADLAKSTSNLMRTLREYIDFQQLREGEIVKTVQKGKRSADIDGDEPNKRQHGMLARSIRRRHQRARGHQTASTIIFSLKTRARSETEMGVFHRTTAPIDGMGIIETSTLKCMDILDWEREACSAVSAI